MPQSLVRKAIGDNRENLTTGLSKDVVLRKVAEKCKDKRLISSGEYDSIFDLYKNQTLQARVDGFIRTIEEVCHCLPEMLDDFLCILHNVDSKLLEEAASNIARSYGREKLPNYMKATAGITAVPDHAAASGATAAVTPSVLVPANKEEPKVEEPVKSDGLGFSRKKDKQDSARPDEDIVYHYPTNKGKHRGIALIINNVDFEGKLPERTSSTKDAEKLKSIFVNLRYKVKVRKDLPAHRMKEVLEELVNDKDIDKEHDSFVCCILSHGDPQGVLGTDNKPVTVSELAKIVNAEGCKVLCGKPKMFFFQACRGTKTPESVMFDSSDPLSHGKKEEVMVADGPGDSVALPPEADFIFGFSTVEGNASMRWEFSGSEYIKVLCDTIEKYASRLSIDRLLLVVNDKVTERSVPAETKEGKKYEYRQMPEIRSTLRGCFYF